eukprot:g5803.t1
MSDTDAKKDEAEPEYSDDGEYSDAEEPAVTQSNNNVEDNARPPPPMPPAFDAGRNYDPKHPPRQGDWTCPRCGANVFASKLACYKCRTPRPAGTGEVKPLPNIPSRPGDWKCPNCEANCFARTTSCFRCQTLRPAGAGQNGYNNNTFKKEIGPGDWFCTQCTALCYANRTACYKCGAPKPADMLNDNFGGGDDKSGGGYNNRNHYNSNAGVRNYRSRPGDWTCPSCNSNVFAYKAQCFRCGEARPAHLGPVPKKEVRPGDWKCEKCEEICFGSRYTCYKCGADRPKIDHVNVVAFAVEVESEDIVVDHVTDMLVSDTTIDLCFI